MESDDGYYIARCLDGHPEDYRHLMQRYERPLAAYLRGKLGDPNTAEETAQESMVRAFFALQRLRDNRRFMGWLVGIADRVCHERRRAAQRDRAVLLAAARRAAMESEKSDDDIEMKSAVAALPDEYREVVLLRYYAGLSCAEIAGQLGAPIGTVTKRLSRAYAMLRETLVGSEVKS